MALVEGQSRVDRRVGPALTSDASSESQNVGDATHPHRGPPPRPLPHRLRKLTLTLLTTLLLPQLPPNTCEAHRRHRFCFLELLNTQPTTSNTWKKSLPHGHMLQNTVIPASCGQTADMSRHIVHGRPNHILRFTSTAWRPESRNYQEREMPSACGAS